MDSLEIISGSLNSSRSVEMIHFWVVYVSFVTSATSFWIVTFQHVGINTVELLARCSS